MNKESFPTITTVVQAESWGKEHIAHIISCPNSKPHKLHKIIVGVLPK